MGLNYKKIDPKPLVKGSCKILVAIDFLLLWKNVRDSCPDSEVGPNRHRTNLSSFSSRWERKRILWLWLGDSWNASFNLVLLVWLMASATWREGLEGKQKSLQGRRSLLAYQAWKQRLHRNEIVFVLANKLKTKTKTKPSISNKIYSCFQLFIF